MSTITGYKQDQQGHWIAKDTEAKLIYAMDWNQWVTGSDKLASASYAITARANDPDPIIKHTQGFNNTTNVSYVELSGGQTGKIYTITCSITTEQGLEDRRSFRIKIENRSA